MEDNSTKLLNLITDTVEFAHMTVERDINHLLQMELTAHLGYGKNSPESEFYHNSRNGGSLLRVKYTKFLTQPTTH